MKFTINLSTSEWTQNDWEQLHRLDQQCFNEPAEGFERAWPMEDLIVESRKGFVIMVKEQVRVGSELICADEVDCDRRQPIFEERLIAACIAYNVSGRLYIASICVHPDWQRRGIAGKMLEMCERFARIAGMPGLWLEYRVDFNHLKHFYHKYGFVDMQGPHGKRKPRDPQPSVKELWRRRKWQKSL